MIALHDSDNTKYPNLALMKISAYFKKKGIEVEFFDKSNPCKYEKIYSSKVFTFSKNETLPKNTVFGGTGNDIKLKLSKKIEHICPDYSLYNLNYSIGFLTRGCPNKCSFCIVPEKEGNIKEHAEIEEFAIHRDVVLMDNNVLASEHGIKQIEKIIKLNLKVDFNQGLDARLIDNSIARLLSKVKWLKPLRMACDKSSQMKIIQKAVTLLRYHNVTPQRYMVYALITDVDEAFERIKFLKGLHLDIHAQPFIDFRNNSKPTDEQKTLARWVNHRAIFKTVTYEEYLKTKLAKEFPNI